MCQNLKEELIWKSSPLLPEGYFISNSGIIQTVDRHIVKKDGSKMFVKGRLIKYNQDKDTYFYINVKSGINKKYKIHRLVAQIFIPNPERKPIVNHKDGNKQNNHVDNLEWTTIRENRQHDVQVLRGSPHLGVHKCGKGYQAVFTQDGIRYRLGYSCDKADIPMLMDKYNEAVEQYEKYNILPDGRIIEENE